MNEPSAFGTNEDHPWYFDSADHPNILPLRCPLSGVDSALDMPPYPTHAAFNYNNVRFVLKIMAYTVLFIKFHYI